MNVTRMTNICPPGPKIWLWASIRCPLFDELGRRLGALVFAKVRPNLLPKMTSHTPKRENFLAVRTPTSEALAEVVRSWIFCECHAHDQYLSAGAENLAMGLYSLPSF